MRHAHYRLAALCLAVAALGLTGCPPDPDAVIDGIEFVWCPPGTFQMGCYPGEQSSSPMEEPRHPVTFAAGFWMSKYEVTRAQWDAVMADKSREKCFCRESDNLPVTYVSWDDIQIFLSTLNTLRPGKNFALPSEAQWEYACRAGTTTRYYWGDDLDGSLIGEYAWYNENGGDDAHAVGGRLPNAWGLHDMSGNLWEWTQDYAHGDYTGAPADGSAWLTPEEPARIVRGGSWYNGSGCRSAYRGAMTPESRFGDYGFRLVMVPEEE